MSEPSDWHSDLEVALRAQLRGAADAGHHDAYELGRQALADGVTLLDLIAAQHRLLVEVSAAGTTQTSTNRLAQVTEFFLEVLSPYEMAHRGYRDANQQLLRWKQMFEQATWGIAISTSGRVDVMNAAFARLYGYSVGELAGQRIEILWPEAGRDQMRAQMALIESQGFASFESVHLRKDNISFPVQVDASAVRDASGKVLYLAINVRDITDRKRNEENLRRAISAAEEANRELDAFSYSVAHDLRAPLRSVDGFSQALLEDYADKLDAEGQSYLRNVRESAQEMAQLIDDLLTLSRITRSELRRQPVDLSQLALKKLATLQRAHPARVVQPIVHDGLVTEADPALLGVVLDNLLGNAWKFTGKQPAASIEVGSLDDGDGQVFFVKDNGAGFDMAYAHKLFGVFQRLHRAEDFEGTGIGLATVQRVIRRHGGRVWAQGEPGRGATFYFTLSGESMP